LQSSTAHLAQSPTTTPAARHRILFTDTTQGGVIGGSLTGILELIAHLDRTRFDPSFVLFEPKPITSEIEAGGMRAHVLPPLSISPTAPRFPGPAGSVARAIHRWRTVAARAGQLVTVIRRERPAIVYSSTGLMPGLAVVVAAARCGVPVICHVKGFRRIAFEGRLLSRWVDTAIFMTDELAEHVRAQGVRARRSLTIYDGIDVSANAAGSGAKIRAEFGIPAEAPVAGIVGHIQGWKGQLLAVEAVARARRHVPELRCLVVGGVHRLGEEYAAKLRERIAAPDLAGHVILAGSRRDVPACLDAMDVVLHCSDREPFGRVLIEAMAAQRPLVAPREGGPCIIVVDGETGRLVPPRDPDAFAAALVEILTDPARRAAMGRAGRERAETVFGIRQHAKAIEAVFDEILTTHASSNGVPR
jgi:glycosyltransferase involved in cell wall biosynthesis